MTEKEISKLTRKELVEMLLDVTRENDRLKEDIERLNRELKVRKIAVETSGTMAEAAMKLNRVFEAADAAAKQYLQNVKARADAQTASDEKNEPKEHHESHKSHKSHGTNSSHESHGNHVGKGVHDENGDRQEAAPSQEPKLVMPEDTPKFDSGDNPFSVSEESVEN